MRRLHGGAEPWARFHREHNGNDDIQIEPWQPEIWEADTNWTCRRKITSSKPISIPAWLCRMFGVLLLCLLCSGGRLHVPAGRHFLHLYGLPVWVDA